MYRRVHCSIFDTLVYPTGLSLCVQGTLVFPIHTPLPARFIPVCTGNIALNGNVYIVISVYPCVYREHGRLERGGYPIIGLSLCVQGTFPLILRLTAGARFIPVCTGNILYLYQL